MLKQNHERKGCVVCCMSRAMTSTLFYCCCHVLYLVVHQEALIFFYPTDTDTDTDTPTDTDTDTDTDTGTADFSSYRETDFGEFATNGTGTGTWKSVGWHAARQTIAV